MRILIASRPFIAFIALAAAFLLLLSGCVTESSYNKVVKERNELRQANAALEDETVEMGTELMLRDLEVAQLEREQQELADEVERWAVRGAIKMMLLADGLHLVLPQDVLFTSGTTTLSSDGHDLIVELVEEINQLPYQIAVLGFTDNVPVGPKIAERYPSNWELAGARAASVVRVMQEAGVPADQLIAVSRGETEPIASNDTEEGRAQNRRIDVRLRPVVK